MGDRDYVHESKAILAYRELNEARANMGPNPGPSSWERLHEAQAAFEALGGYDAPRVREYAEAEREA